MTESVEIFTNHPISWLILSILIIYSIYTSIIVKEEKFAYLENAISLSIDNFTLLIPTWWKEEKFSNNHYEFTRREENYDWKAQIEVITAPQSDLLSYYASILKDKKILLDETNSIVQNCDHLLKKFKSISPEDILHIESMGTLNEEKRIYLSSYLILINENKNKKLIVANSLSSVLNGMLEGPYFEEVVYRIKLR